MNSQPDLFSAHTITGKQPTSRAAALSALPKSGSQRARMLAVLVRRFPTGMTDEELLDSLPGFSSNAVRPRRGELVDGGWVMNSGCTKKTRSGNNAILWLPTVKALQTMKAA